MPRKKPAQIIINFECLKESLQTIKNLNKPPDKYSILYSQSEDVSSTQIRFKQLQISETIVCILACTGFGFAAIVSDLTFDDTTSEPFIILILEISCTISTVLLIFSIYHRIKQEFLWEQARGIYSYIDTIFSTGKINQFYIEALINSVHIPVFLNNQSFITYNSMVESDIEYRYTTIIAAFMVIRVYHILNLLSIFSAYRSCRSQRLCQLNGSFAGPYYAGKCMMQEHPLMVMIWMLLSGIFVFGFLLKVFERPAASLTAADLNNYSNAMWCIITTMTTVGYGDYYPVTIPGRVCGCIACLWGVLVVSFMCCSVVNLLMLDTGQQNSLVVLHRLWYKHEIKQVAACVLTSVYRYRYMVKYKKGVKEGELNVQLGKVRKYISEFQRCRDKQRTLYNYDSKNEIFEYKLDDIIDLVKGQQSDLEIEELVEKLEKRVLSDD